MTTTEVKEKFLAGEMPKCYRPCIPFYKVCNEGAFIVNEGLGDGRITDGRLEKCAKCFDDFDLDSDIE